MRQHRDGSQRIAMPYPRFLRMVKSVCQPLLLQKLIPVLAEVQGLATPVRLFIIVNNRILNNKYQIKQVIISSLKN